MTAAYLFLDLQAGTGRYNAAGHPPLLHYRAADNSIRLLQAWTVPDTY